MKKIIISLFVIFLFSTEICAQKNELFSQLEFELSASRNLYNPNLKNYWEPSTGFNLGGFLPLGNVKFGAGIQYLPFEGSYYIYPDFKTIFLYSNLALENRIYSDIKMGFGISAGSYLMDFEDQNSNEYENTESEFGVGIFHYFSIPVFKELSIKVQSSFLTVFTKKKIRLFNAEIGLNYRMNSPEWIKDLLK